MQSSWSLKCSHISARKLTLCFIPYCFYCIKILHPLWIMNSSFVDTADAMGGRLIHPEKSVWLGAKSASFFGNEKLGDHQDSSQNLESRAIKKNRIISYVFRLFLNDVSKLSMKMLQMHPPAFFGTNGSLESTDSSRTSNYFFVHKQFIILLIPLIFHSIY